MNSDYQARLKMYDSVETFVANNAAGLNVVSAFDGKFKLVKERLKTVRTLIQTADEDTKAITQTRNLAIEDICNKTVLVSDPVKAYAGDIGDLELKAMMPLKAKKLKRDNTHETIGPACQKIYDKADKLRREAAPFNLTDLKMTNLDTAIKKWESVKTATRNKQVEISGSLAKAQAHIDACDLLMKDLLHPMVNSLADTDPDLVKAWVKITTVIYPGATSTQSQITVTNKANGEGLEGVQLKLWDKDFTHTATTDHLGKALFIDKIKPRHYQLTATLPGFQTFALKDFWVKLGKMNKLAIVLEEGAEAEVPPPVELPVAIVPPVDK